LFSEINDREGFVRAVASLSLCAGHAGDHERATMLAAASATYQRDLGMRPVFAAAMRELEAAREAAARSALGDSAFAAAAERGRLMDHSEIVALVLGSAVSNTKSAPRASRRTILTARELEVAALIAEGLTNNQIAARLVVTQRTARGHVENIFTKLGVNSRAQVATWFADPGDDMAR
jgi:non-specific serine/threonine protein kinase